MRKLRFSIASIVACGLGFAAGQPVIAALVPSDYQVLSSKEFKEFKLQPHLNVWGETGSYTFGKGQLLVPMYGGHTQVLYGLLEGAASLSSDKGWFGGAGTGYRSVINDDMIVGGYAIIDYSRAPDSKNNFWIANPGVEIMGVDWDVTANAYFPLRSSKATYSTTDWGTNFGISDYVKFSGHNGYDRMMQRRDSDNAAAGFDVKIGKNIPHFEQAKISLGGYYFKMKEFDSIKGGLVKLSYELSRYAALELRDSYDNYNRNKVLLGVKLTLGGYSNQEKQDFGIAARLLDTVEHGYINTIVPVRTRAGDLVLLDNQPRLRYDKLWFVKPAASITSTNANGTVAGSGTYEDPFIGFSASNFDYLVAANQSIGTLTAYPMLYFAPGAYSFSDFTTKSFDGTTTWDNTFSLPTGFGVYGRSSDYKAPAIGAIRPIFNGALVLAAPSGSVGGNNTIDSVMFNYSSALLKYADNPSRGVVSLSNAQNVTLRNVQIGLTDITSSSVELYASNSSVDLYNTTINNHYDDPYLLHVNQVALYGIFARNNSTINLRGGNVIDVNFDDVLTSTIIDQCHGHGIYATNSTVNFLTGNNSIRVNNGTSQAQGIDAMLGSTINFNGGSNTINVMSYTPAYEGAYSSAYGIYNYNSNVNFSGGTNTITALASTDSAASTFISRGFAIYSTVAASNNTSNITFSGGVNTLNGIAQSSTGRLMYGSGLHADGGTTVNFTGGSNILVGTFINSSSTQSLAGSVAAGLSSTGALEANTINIAGGTNRIVGNSSSLYATSVPVASAIVIDAIPDIGLYYPPVPPFSTPASTTPTFSSTINITGGENSFAATTSANGNANGIFDAEGNGILKFNGGRTSIELNNSSVDTSQYNAYGINAQNATRIFNGAVEIKDYSQVSLDNLLAQQNISISKSGSVTSSSKKILWGAQGYLDW